MIKKSSPGFSLVELMVVVGIIGILSAIAIPKLQMFSAKAKRVEAQNMLKLIGTLNESSFAENSHYLRETEINAQISQGKNYRLFHYRAHEGVNNNEHYFAAVELIAGKSLCPGVQSDRWVIGECSRNCVLFPIIPNVAAASFLKSNGEGGGYSISGGPYPVNTSLNCQ
jgi:prepilin-type N-terminal cleavage/methylation domain-containing protein